MASAKLYAARMDQLGRTILSFSKKPRVLRENAESR
jgi:hypothetical protein